MMPMILPPGCDGEDARALALQVEGEVALPLLQQLMGEAMRHQGVEALEIEQRLDIAAARRIAVVDGGEVGAERAAQLGMVGEHLGKRLGDQACVDIGMIEPLRQAMAHRVLEPVLAQDGRIDEAAERRFLADDVIGFAAQLRPDRIHGSDLGLLGRARFRSHVSLLGPLRSHALISPQSR
jgi:hypothetical protein